MKYREITTSAAKSIDPQYWEIHISLKINTVLSENSVHHETGEKTRAIIILSLLQFVTHRRTVRSGGVEN
jgi:hypothetical protein